MDDKKAPREVLIPAPGRLYLSHMPGSRSPFDEDRERISALGVDTVIALTGLDEIRVRSPSYADAVEGGLVPWEYIPFPVDDFGVPQDRTAFLRIAKNVAAGLRSGKTLLIHCGAGIGRSGTLAIATLLALGVSLPEAQSLVLAAGGSPETEAQGELVSWAAKNIE